MKLIANDSTETGETIFCLSIRQPWAWLIVNGHKNIENRTRMTSMRGFFMIHASKTMTRMDYDLCHAFTSIVAPHVTLPSPEHLLKGGIIGSALLLDSVRAHSSPWFQGPCGYVLGGQVEHLFTPCSGRLGFFPFNTKK